MALRKAAVSLELLLAEFGLELELALAIVQQQG
jgi:hypothetical protein